MASILFDTHAYVKTMVAAGFTERQAEVQADAPVKLIDERLATKRDMEELRAATKHDLRELELRLTVRLGAIVAAGIGIVAVLVKLL